MSQGFGRTKRRIAESKRQKREDKRRKRLHKDTPAPPALEPQVLAPGETDLAAEPVLPADTA